MPGVSYFGPARVLKYDEAERRVQVLISLSESKKNVHKSWARLAIPNAYTPRWGDTVLVAGDDRDHVYVLGLLNTQAPEPASPEALVLKNGARAVVDGTQEKEKLRVFTKEGGLIFEYDPRTGKSRVNVPTGDLEVVTRNGDIAFTSARGIRFHSKGPIEMESPKGIGLTASSDFDENHSSLKLGSRKASLTGPELDFKAQRGDIEIEEVKYLGKRFSGKISNVRVIMERLETFTNNVIDKARNVYKTVEGLTQLRTGRMRTLVDETYQLKSKKAFLKSEGDFKVRGDKIYLG
jgi:hypothetical protein